MLEGREVGTPGSRKSSGVNPEGLLHPIALLPVLWTGILSPFSRTDVGSPLGLDLRASGSSQAGCSDPQGDGQVGR